MSALDELSLECERHGWRLRLSGVYAAGRGMPGLEVTMLEVTGRGGQGLLARARVWPHCGPARFEVAAVACNLSLREQGLVRG